MPFRDIAGHRHLLELIAGAAMRSTLPPSLIFAGPDGVGKRTSAVALAQLLNCHAPHGAAAAEVQAASLFDEERDERASAASDGAMVDACGACPSCKRIARGVHADVLLIAPEDSGSIKVEAVRDAIDRAAYRPFEGRRRLVIVDQADQIVEPAQNALLKTLEEPPPASMFVLVTSRPDLLLPTVRSRCQRLRFGRLSPEDVAEVLIRTHGYSEADAHAAASMSDGSVGAALDGSTDAYADARDAAAHLLEGTAASKDPRRRLESARALMSGGRVADRDELARRLQAVSSILRDLGVLLSSGDEHTLANSDLRPQLERLSRSFDRKRVVDAFAAVDRALQALDRNASPKVVADWIAFQI